MDRSRHSGIFPVLLLVVGTALGGCSGGSPAGTASPAASPSSPPPPVATATLAATPARSPSSPSPAWAEPNEAALPDATASKLQAQLVGLAACRDVIGLSAAVVSPAGSWAGATGVDAAGTAIKPTSAYAIADITKTFVGAEVLLLASGGKIDLDAPVTTYVSLPFATNGATIRQLATMTSGFPGLPAGLLDLQVPKDLSHAWTAAELVTLAKDQPRQGTPGGPGVFNGLNYVVLGMVIEKVTGEPLATVLRRDLLAPSALDRIWMQPAEKPQPPLTVAVDSFGVKVVDPASGYLPSLASASTGVGGAGMAADAPSLARWGYLLYGGRIIDGDLVATMTTKVADTAYGAYGFGTMVADVDGQTVFGHPGRLPAVLLPPPGLAGHQDGRGCADAVAREDPERHAPRLCAQLVPADARRET